MKKKNFGLNKDKSEILIHLAISIRNSGYLLLTVGILNIIIGFLSIFKIIGDLDFQEMLTFLAEDVSDLEFLLILDTFVTPFFCIILAIYAINSYKKLFHILDELANHLPLVFPFLRSLTRFFQIIFIYYAVYSGLLLFKLIIFS